MAEHVTHGFGPLYDAQSDTLILGSFPSVKSREQAFFYGHPQNRFWKILAAVYGWQIGDGIDPSRMSVEEKRDHILQSRLALYDVIEECDITGSSDASIRSVIPADLAPILTGSRITRIFVNGKTAEKYYIRYQEDLTGIRAGVLPSSSPANAAWSLERLIEEWRRQLTGR